ncbi:MAG: YIP1 family protein [Desulfovibrio sp.]|nr:YIP1 family protein [Desulfovibrio sp.]
MSRSDLPKPVVIATCPKCGTKFRFSVKDTPESSADSADDPLPKGAIVFEGREETSASDERADCTPEEEKRSQNSEKRLVGRARPFSSKTLFGCGAGNPWDHAPGRIGWFASFYQACLRVMFQGPRFFRSLTPTRTFHRPLFFYLIVCLFELLVNYGWLTVFRQTLLEANDPELTALFAILAPDGNILFMVLLQAALSTLKLYVTSALFFLVFQLIAPERNDYGVIFQVVAYSVAPTVLAVVPLAGSLCGALWSVACLAIGLREVLEISWPKTVLAFFPVLFLIILAMRFLTSF